MKNQTITLMAALLLSVIGANAQSGLQQIFVEKFYVSNATDAAEADAEAGNAGNQTGTLPAGSITWRIYADLEPGWGVQSVYGVNGHPLQLITSTNFYNHPSGNATGGPLPTSNTSLLSANTTILDSYFTCGAVATNRFGVVKSEDNSAATPSGGGANLVFSPAGVLANADTSIGLPLTTADGMYNTVNNPALLALTTLGDVTNATMVSLLTDGSSVGNSFTSTNCSWGVLGQQVGAFPTGSNRVLLGQFTTNGVFTYKLNLQIRNTSTFQVRNFVYDNPTGNEVLFPSLSGTLNLGCSNTTSATAITTCGSYSWNGSTYTTSGTYTYTTTNASGCDSIASLTLTLTTPPTWFLDSDGDGYGVASVSVAACTQPSGYSFDNSDCNDNIAAVYPSATEICNGIDDDCDGDVDSDDANVTGQQLWYADVDGDGLGDATDTLRFCNQPLGYVSNSNDCDDSNATVLAPVVYYADADQDAYGNPNVTQSSCTGAPSGYVGQAGDCNDNSAAVNPGIAIDDCNGVDNDCDGLIDENATFLNYYVDTDADGYGAGSATSSCAPVPGSVTVAGDCNNSDASINPAASEVCNGVDDNCDNVIDNGVPVIAAPTAISGNATACLSSVAGTLVFSCDLVAGATGYNWTVPTGLSILSGQGTNTVTLSYSDAAIQAGITGQICVYAADACTNSTITCLNVSYQVVSPVSPGPISGPSKLCPGVTQTYSVVAVPRATAYTWTVPSGVTLVSGQGTNAITVNVGVGYTGGVFSVIAANICGQSAARTKAVAQNLPVTPGVISGRKDGVCNTNAVAYSITPVANATSYVWTVNGGTITSGQGTTGVNVNYITSTSNTVTVRSVNGCGTSAIRSLTVLGVPARPGEITGSATPCANTNVAYSVATVTGATLYSWATTAAGAVASGQGTKNVTVNWAGPASGQGVRVVAANSCGNSTTRTLSPITVGACARETSTDVYSLNAWPNPVSGTLYLSFSATEDNYRLNIVDALGRIVFNREGNPDAGANMMEVSVSDFAAGVYIVSLESAGIRSFTRVIVE